MSLLQELDAGQINGLLQAAVEKTLPSIVTIAADNTWVNLHSQVRAVRGTHLLLDMPYAEAGMAPHEFTPGERIGVNFKLKHHKYIFSATVVGQERVAGEGNGDAPALAIVSPTRMQRLQRRAFIRADVPANRIVRASFWLGGRDAEPCGTSVEHQAWTGQVLNISAGGFQMLAGLDAATGLDIGDVVGLRVVFGAGGETVYADAQFRHVDLHGDRVMLGFQFLGLTETPEGRVALQMISAKVNEFQRYAEKAGNFRQN